MCAPTPIAVRTSSHSAPQSAHDARCARSAASQVALPRATSGIRSCSISWIVPLIGYGTMPGEREEPAPETGSAPPRLESSEGMEHRLLHQVVELVPHRTAAVAEPGHRWRVTFDEPCCRPLIARPLGGGEVMVARGGRLYRQGHRSRGDGGRRKMLSYRDFHLPGQW